MEIIEARITNIKDINSVAQKVEELEETKQDKLTEDLTATISLGKITAGKTWAAGTSLETILRDILG